MRGLHQGQRVTHWREEPLEIDAVFEGSWGNWAVEVKTGSFDIHALKGLLEFCRRNPEFMPLVIAAPGSEIVPRRHGLRGVSWEEFLIFRAAGARFLSNRVNTPENDSVTALRNG